MTLSDKMTALMNATRSSVGINGKLTFLNATKALEEYSKMSNQLLAFPEVVFSSAKSKPVGISQIIEFDSQGFFEILPSNLQYLDVKKGDKIRQSFLLETVNDITDFHISFYAENTGHQFPPTTVNHVGKDLYKVSADYTCIADAHLRILDLYEAGIPAGHIVFKLSQPFVGFISQVGG